MFLTDIYDTKLRRFVVKGIPEYTLENGITVSAK